MANALEAALRGNRRVATAAGDKELLQLEAYCSSGANSIQRYKDARKQQLRHCTIVMFAICKAAPAPEGSGNLDIYWSIVRRLLALRPKPSACVVSWSRFLQYLQYFHIDILLQKKMFAEAAEVVAYLDCEADKLQTATDYKFMFRIYGVYLLKQAAVAANAVAANPTQITTTTMSTTSENCATTAAIVQALNAFAALFAAMLRQNIDLNFEYPQLIVDFQQALMSKQPSLSIFRLHAMQLPALERIAMYGEFFTLLAGQREAPRLSADELCLSAQAHIEALSYFIQIDVQNRLRQPQVALRHLRVLRDAPLLRDDPAMSYALTVLYFYVKLVWSCALQDPTLPPPTRFVQTYVEVCAKFGSFFRKSGEALVQQAWFLDTLVALQVLLMQMMLPAGRAAIAAASDSASLTAVDGFWSQMRVESYAAHFELIVGLIQLAPHITKTKLAAWPCCTSVRKHIILNLALAAFSAYSTFVLTCEEEEKTECSEALNENFKLILRHALNALSQMACSNPKSQELQMFYARFLQLTRDVRTPRQARFCLTLADQLPKARSKFSDTQWRQLQRRLYQTAAFSGQQQLADELQSDYIAAELQSLFSDGGVGGDGDSTLCCDFTSVRKQIAIFYMAKTAPTSALAPEPAANAAPTRDKCLLALHEASRSVMKPALQPRQKRLLYWLDAHYVFRYPQLATPELQSSLQICAPTLYEFVWVVRAASSKLPPSQATSAEEKLRRHCRALLNKAAPLDRLEQLCLGHARSRLLFEQLDAQKKLLSAILDLKETRNASEYLEELLQRKEFQTAVSVAAELQLVQLAVEAQQAFTEFFDKADTEPISSDAAYIDWEFIVDDLATLANFLDYSGYLEYVNRTWQLHYRIASTLQDDYSALRSLAFFCEHVEHYEPNSTGKSDTAAFDLTAEVNKRLPQIVQMLEALPTLRDRHHSWLLCCCCQLAHFYAYAGNFSYAEMLLQLVQLKLQELPARRGKFDLVQGTLGVVQFRILWKQQHRRQAALQAATATPPRFLHEYVLRSAEQTLNQFHQFVSVASSDHIGYMILILNFMQQLTECLANRLCDHFSESVLLSVLHSAVQAGAALRIVQVLTWYMLVNLQMEEPAKALLKLKFIEFIMGTKTLEQLTKYTSHAATTAAATSNSTAAGALLLKEACSIKYNAKEPIVSEMLSLQLNPSMEMVRRVAQVHMSPIKMEKIRLSPRHCDLKRFLRYQPNTNGTSPLAADLCEILQWMNYAVGCMNARIYFLAEEYEQLEGFYETCIRWWQQRQHRNTFLVRIFRNFWLLSMQHYANYLRAHKKSEKAAQCLESTLDECVRMAGNVDTVYGINLQLQLRNAKAEAAAAAAAATAILKQENTNGKCTATRGKPLRRALEFSSQDGELKATPRTTKRGTQQQQQAVAPRPMYVAKKVPIVIYNSETDKTSHRLQLPNKTEAAQATSAASHKTHEIATLAKEPSVDLDLCQVIEMIELDDSVCSDLEPASAKEIPKKMSAAAAAKQKPTSSKTTTTVATTSRRRKVEAPIATPQFSITDLVNASASKSQLVPAARKRHSPPAAELSDRMKAMKITTSSKAKAAAPPTQRKAAATAAQTQNFIIVEDSPEPAAQPKPKPKSLRTKSEVPPKPATAAATTTTVVPPATRRGRLRKAATENLENIAEPSSALQKSESAAAASTARRRQKI